MGANSFLYEMTPIYMGGNNENDRDFFPKSVSIYLMLNRYIFKDSTLSFVVFLALLNRDKLLKEISSEIRFVPLKKNEKSWR